MIIISHKNRINLLATYLIEHEYVSILDIKNEFNISRRSAFYWINDLNEKLDEMELDQLNNLTQSKYFLSSETKSALQHYDNLVDEDYSIKQLNKNQRQNLMIWFLVQKNNKVTLANMAKFFNISKNTAINDIQYLKNTLPQEFTLNNSKHGKILIGDERKKRIWVYQQMCMQTNLQIIKDTHGSHYRFLIKELNLLQKHTRTIFSDNALELMATFLSWCLKRIQLNPNLMLGTSPYQNDLGDKIVDEWSIGLMQHYEIYASNEEISFFRNIVYSAQTKNTAHWKFIAEFPADKLVNQIIERFGSISGAVVTSSALKIGLKNHIISTYQRIKSGIPYRAANLKEIKSEYSELMALTSYAIQPLETYLHKSISDDEISLITTYFGGQTNYLQNTKKFNSNIDVLLVCSSGVGTSYFLQQTLIRKYNSIKFSHPMSLAEFSKLSSLIHAKVIVSTVEIKSSEDIPCIIVQGIPTENDFIKIENTLRNVGLLESLNSAKMTNDIMDIISNEVMIKDPQSLSDKILNYFNGNYDTVTSPEFINDHPAISDLLTSENIHVTGKKLTWKQAIQKSFLPLLSNGLVENTYVTEIINKLEEKGPFMIVKKGVLLAHSSPSAKVHRVGMSLLKLKSPIKMDDKIINVIICLAPRREKQHLQALSSLLDILQNTKKYQILINATSKKELVDLITSYK
jgi:transcriptional antiterminator/mannitol/fructose-specific phosphotransferase system IIA component (Ntr-type)